MSYNTKSQLTKQALCDALKKLLARKSIDQITIGEITAEAGFNRQTFYYHFRDIYDLLTWTFDQELNVIRPYLDKPDVNWRETLRQAIIYLGRNKYLCRCVVRGVGREQLMFTLHDSIYGLIKYILLHENDIRPMPARYLDFTVEFYTYAISHSLYDWISNGMRETPEELIDLLSFVINNRQQAM